MTKFSNDVLQAWFLSPGGHRGWMSYKNESVAMFLNHVDYIIRKTNIKNNKINQVLILIDALYNVYSKNEKSQNQ